MGIVVTGLSMEKEATVLINKWFRITAAFSVLSVIILFLNSYDTNGSKSLQSAQRSLYSSYIFYTPDQLLDEWVKLESVDTNWHEVLPKCPENIVLKYGAIGQVLVIHPDPEKWTPVSSAGTLHGEATYAIRSIPTLHSSSQCTYDREGKLYSLQVPEAGTADFYSPSKSKYLHHIYDVEPYVLARELNRISDYYKARPAK